QRIGVDEVARAGEAASVRPVQVVTAGGERAEPRAVVPENAFGDDGVHERLVTEIVDVCARSTARIGPVSADGDVRQSRTDVVGDAASVEVGHVTAHGHIGKGQAKAVV